MLGGASFAVFSPLLAYASIFSFSSLLGGTASQSSAAASNFNSQTVPLLAAAVNIDPRPSTGGGDITVVGETALLPQDGPSGTAADIYDERPAASAISVYTVRKGDSLSGIAKMFSVSVNTIVWANDIKGGVIREGDTLVILPITGVKYTVKKGDTLASLAKDFKSDAHEIAQYNDLADAQTLTVGSVVIIPEGEISTKAAPKPSTTKPSSNTAKIKSIASGKTTEPYLGGSGPALDGFFDWPVGGGIITQGLHGWNGVDIGAPKGTPIYAAAGGTVIIARQNGAWNGGYGNYIVIKHENGTQTLYAHASKVNVTAGEQVSQGETIGLVGSTGQSTGSHLHFEVRGAKNPFAN